MIPVDFDFWIDSTSIVIYAGLRWGEAIATPLMDDWH